MLPTATAGNGGWVEVVDAESEAREISQPSTTARKIAVHREKGWEARPTFFEYLYGA